MNILLLSAHSAGRETLAHHCQAIFAGQPVHFSHAPTPEAADGTDEPDLVLFDLPSNPEAALAWLARHPATSARTILLSADPGVAVRAFEVGARDFVPQPASHERLERAIARRLPPASSTPPADQRIAVRRFGRIELVAVDDLLYVEGADKYSELVLADGQRSFHDQCLGRMEATLPRSFVRIHKSYLVRFPMISRLLVLRGSRYFAVLKNGQRLPVGRSRYAQIKSRLL